MKRRDTADYLAPVPPQVRARMMAADRLEPGAVGRFFEAIRQRGEPVAAFDAAAESESTLAMLLRALQAFAPEVCLASGREARQAWYHRRPKAGAPRRHGRAPLPAEAPACWPVEWALLYPALLRPPRSRDQPPALRRFDQQAGRGPAPRSRSRLVTVYGVYPVRAAGGAGRSSAVANCFEGLICLGRHGRLDDARLADLREMPAVAASRAAREGKRKVARLAKLTERGSFMVIGEAIGRLRAEAAALPASSAAAERLRQMAAVLTVEINAYAPHRDVARWRLGIDLVRVGTWRLAWHQGKNSRGQDLDELWPEIGEVLDELILGRRPRRYASLRYADLRTRNWLALTDTDPPACWPSQLFKEAIAVPLHDLRTLLADHLRRVDTARARELIGAMLGHGSTAAGEDYRSKCDADAGVPDWLDVRRTIRAEHSPRRRGRAAAA